MTTPDLSQRPTVTVVNTYRGMWAVRCSDIDHNGCDLQSNCLTATEAGKLADEHLFKAHQLPAVRDFARLARRWADLAHTAEGQHVRAGFLAAVLAVNELPDTPDIRGWLWEALNEEAGR